MSKITIELSKDRAQFLVSAIRVWFVESLEVDDEDMEMYEELIEELEEFVDGEAEREEFEDEFVEAVNEWSE